MVAAFLIGSLRDERQGRIGLAIVAGSAAIVALNDPARSLSEVLLIPAIFALAWLGGFAHRERAVQALEAEERARRAEREREVAARLAVAEERARIARELHDIVAHAVSVMVLQIGAVRHRLPGEHRRGRRGAARRRGDRSLRASARCAGCSARCAAATTAPSSRPRPGSAASTSCSREIRRAGLPVELHVDGDPVPPAGGDRPLRLPHRPGGPDQRAQARARRAAPTSRIRYAADELRIEVSDDGDGAADASSDGRGHGLVGVRERVKLYGGEMSAATANGGGFRLTTTLPLTGTAS